MASAQKNEAPLGWLWKRAGANGVPTRDIDRLVPEASLLAASVVVGLTLYWYGVGLQGLDVATRSSARFSALVFAVALAMRVGRTGTAWMRGFVAAHLVHYAAVLYQAVTDVHTRMHVLSASHSVVIVAGVMLLLPLAFASPDSTRGWRRLNAVAVFLAWGTFAGGAALNAARYPMALVPLIPLSAALAMHVYRLRTRRSKRRIGAAVSSRQLTAAADERRRCAKLTNSQGLFAPLAAERHVVRRLVKFGGKW